MRGVDLCTDEVGIPLWVLTPAWTAHLDREIGRLSRIIFGRPVPALDLELLVADLHDPRKLASAGFPNNARAAEDYRRNLETSAPGLQNGGGHASVAAGRFGLLHDYLADSGVFDRGRELEWIDPCGEAELLAELQLELRREIAVHGLAIEVNPSSNLLIGNIGDLRYHPLWRLSGPNDDHGEPHIPVVLGTDNPVNFATNLLDEYMHLRDGLMLSGATEEQTTRWINRVAQASLNFRSTVQRDLKAELLECPFPAEPAEVWLGA